jgi:hypothetical protein
MSLDIGPRAPIDPGTVTPSAAPERAPHLIRRRWRLPALKRGLLSRRLSQAVISVLAVAILILSSSMPNFSPAPQNHANTAGSPNPAGNLSTNFPYLFNATTYPAPDQLPSSATNVSLPQLTVTSYDAAPGLAGLGVASLASMMGNTFLYGLVYVSTSSSGIVTLEFSSSRLNASGAGAIMANPNCVSNCPSHLPIAWGGSIAIAGFGTSKVTADAVGASGSSVVVAATSSGSTRAWYSPSYGTNSTWVPLLGGGSVAGASPRLAVQSCAAILTTISAGSLVVTSLKLPCISSPGIGLLNAVTPGTLWSPVVTMGGHGPLLPSPTVTSVTASTGAAGIVVTIHGTNYLSGAVAFFGPVPAFTTYVSGTTLTALVPAQVSLTATFDVTVTVAGVASALNPPYDHFTYTPSVFQVTPAEGQPGITVNVTGVAFTGGSQLFFNGALASSFHYVNAEFVTAVVPNMPVGVIDVTAGGPAHPGDQFTVVALPVYATVSQVISAQPLFLSPNHAVPEQAVVVDSSSNSSVELLTSTNNFTSYIVHWVAHTSSSMGSPLLGSLGPTRVQVIGGTSGEITATDVGPYLFVGFTTRQLEETSLQTVVSNDSGNHWNATYLVVSTNGSLDSPQAVATPAGYVYLTWRSNGQGGWSVDQQAFSDNGRILTPVTAIPGPGGKSGSSAQSLSFAVDGWQRPLYAWNLTNSTRYSVIQYTGAYLTAQEIVPFLWQQFNQTVPADFRSFGTASVAHFMSYVAANFTTLSSDLHSSNWAGVQSVVLTDLYPLLTVNKTGFAFRTPSTATYPCTGSPGAATSWLANASGPFSSGTKFGVYAAWLLEAAGCGALIVPKWPGAIAGIPIPVVSTSAGSSLPTPSLGRTLNPYVSGYGSANITPIAINPNVVLLQARSSFPGSYYFAGSHGTGCTGGSTYSYYPVNFSLQTPPGPLGVPVLVSSRWALPDLYLTNLSANSNGTWTLSAKVYFVETDTTYIDCSGTITKGTTYVAPTLGPSSLGFTLNGTYTTYLGSVPSAPPIRVLENSVTGLATLYSNFTASVLSTVHLFSVTEGGGAYFYGSTSTTVGRTSENLSIAGAPITATSISYTAVYQLNSTRGTTKATWPALNYQQVSSYTRPLWANYSYSFQVVSNPVGIWLGTNPVANVTATDATVQWDSNQTGTGWVRYQEAGGGQYQQSALLICTGCGGTGHQYRYQAELHGLNPWSFYVVLAGVDAKVGTNPVIYENYMEVTFQTTAAVLLGEWESPIDSITGEGGGAMLFWNWPVDFSGYSYLNGSLNYWPTNQSSSRVTVPIPQLSQYSVGWHVGAFGANLTALNRNWTYTASLFLNFSYQSKTFSVTNEPFTFQYARDSAGSGLTDSEKTRGWNVTIQTGPASFLSYTAQANPRSQATNGLTRDFFEKEFGLDPNRISTTSDGMLDAWNVTFNLGTGSPALPNSGFQFWYENSSYRFNKACPDPMQSSCSFTPLDQNASNLTDNSPWASEVLWSGTGSNNALAKLQGLIATQNLGWLRAVSGTYRGLRTLTVWGKLSWGADPLAWSTSEGTVGTGVPGDGSKVNPLGLTDVNVTLTSWSMDGLANGDGVSAFIHAVSNATQFLPSGQTDYSGYSLSSTSPGGGDSWYGPSYSVNFQVAPTEQKATLNFSMVANNSGNGFMRQNTGAIYPDLDNASSHAVSLSSSLYTLNLTYRVVPVYSKSNTLVILPGDNSTLSNLPLGLRRFTGEQDFILLEVNDTVAGTNSLHVVSIPYINSSAGNGISTATYNVSLNGGMNNILIPRSIFVRSPLGQVLLLNRTNASIASTMFNGLLWPSWDPATWQARVLGYSSWNGSTYSPGTQKYVKVYSNTNQNCTIDTECGVVPSDLAADSQVPSYAIDSVFALNLTTNIGLKGLLAGLLLNTSGNYSNWGFAATPFLPDLGLSAEVLSALANPVEFNGGGFFAPGYQQPSQPQSWWQEAGSTVWNAVSGTVGAVLSVAWSWVQAAAAFIAYLANEVANWGLGVIQQTVSVLHQVAGAIVWAIDQLASIVLTVIDSLMSAALSPIKNAAAGFDSALGGAANRTLYDINTNGSVGSADALAWAQSFDPLVVMGIAVTIVAGVAIAVMAPIELGGSFLSTIIWTLIGTFLLGALAPYVTALTSAAVTALDNAYTNTISTSDWQALAGTVAICAATGDFFFAILTGALKGGSLNGAGWEALATAIIIDLLVLTISIVSWATHLGLIAIAALFFGAIGAYLAFRATRDPTLTAIKTYVNVALALSFVGLGAAGGDIYIAES